MMASNEQYFDWIFWRFGWASGSYWKYMIMDDESEWFRIGLGLYWRVK